MRVPKRGFAGRLREAERILYFQVESNKAEGSQVCMILHADALETWIVRLLHLLQTCSTAPLHLQDVLVIS